MKSKVVSLYGKTKKMPNEHVQYSVLLNDFIKPFKQNFPEDYGEENIISFGMNAWNFGNMNFILPDNAFQKVLSTAATIGFETAIMKKMIDYKVDHYKEYTLFIADFSFEENDGGPLLTVQTEPEEVFLRKLMDEASHPSEKTDYEEGYINRYALIIKPKKSYYNWVASIDDLFMPYDESEVNIYLVNEEIVELDSWIKMNYKKIFDYELENEFTDKKLWPKKRTYKMFQQWFSVDFSKMIYDLEDYPVFKE